LDNRKLFSLILGRTIRKNRIAKGLTLEELASIIKMDDKHLGKVERGEKTPGSYTLTRLQIALKFNSDEFIHEFVEKKKKVIIGKELSFQLSEVLPVYKVR